MKAFVVLGAALALVASACPGYSQSAAVAIDVDATFVVAAMQGNDAEIDLATLALRRSHADEARQFAQQMLADHTELAQRLAEVVAHPPAMPARLNDGDRLTFVRLANLPDAGFDQEYLTSQVGDHLATIGAFDAEAEDGRDPALKAFAQRQLPMLKAHLELALDATRHIGGGGPFKSH